MGPIDIIGEVVSVIAVVVKDAWLIFTTPTHFRAPPALTEVHHHGTSSRQKDRSAQAQQALKRWAQRRQRTRLNEAGIPELAHMEPPEVR